MQLFLHISTIETKVLELVNFERLDAVEGFASVVIFSAHIVKLVQNNDHDNATAHPVLF